LLRAARPKAGLPPGFEQQVWKRIERGERESLSGLERLSQWLLTPKFAAAALTCVILVAAGAGAIRGAQTGDQQARDRYLSSVDPSYFQR
jgi:hypothetical protein